MLIVRRKIGCYKNRLIAVLLFVFLTCFNSCKPVVTSDVLAASVPADSRIIYITDLEGDKSLIDELIEKKELVWKNGDELHFTDPKTVLVFGGDLTDRGHYNIRLMRWINDLKKRHRNRVVLLWGNRDLNKLKFLSAEKELREGKNKVFAEWLATNKFENNLENQMIWFFEHELGLRDFFSMRLEELIEIGDVKNTLSVEAQRSAAAKIIFEQLKPGGEYFRYAESGQILFRHKNNVFIHGGFSESNVGAIPRKQRVGAKEWLGEGPNSLNKWGRDSFAEIKNGFKNQKPYSEFLLAYGDSQWNPITSKNQGRYESVIYPIRIEEDGVFRLPEKSVIEYLKTAGVDTEIVGHTPAGSCPMPLVGEHYIRVMADTSFGSKKGFLQIEQNGVVAGHGKNKAGENVSFRLRSDWKMLPAAKHSELGLSKYAGRIVDGSVVVGHIENTEHQACLKYKGYETIEGRLPQSNLSSTVESSYPTYQVNQSFEASRFTKNNVNQTPVYDRFSFRDLIGTRRLMWFSGSSEGSWGFVTEPNRKIATDFIKQLIASLNPEEVVIATGGTEFGIHKIIHDEVEAHNQKNPDRRFTTVGLIAEIANSSQVAPGLDGVVVTGKYWEETGPVAIKVVEESNGHAVFIGGGGIVKGELGFIQASKANFSLLRGPEGEANNLSVTRVQNAVSNAAEVMSKFAKTRLPAKKVKATSSTESLEGLSNENAGKSFVDLGKTTNELKTALKKYGQVQSESVASLMKSYNLSERQVEEVIKRVSENPKFIEEHRKESASPKAIDIVSDIIRTQAKDVKTKF